MSKHPCPTCRGTGRQTSQYNRTAYFQCCRCGLAFSETMRGDSVEVAYRAKVIREAYDASRKPYGR